MQKEVYIYNCLQYILTRLLILILILLLSACKNEYTPRPKGYFRIDFPEKKYQEYKSDCPYTFEYPVYGVIVEYNRYNSEPCWIDIEFPKNKGKIHITYKTLNNNLARHIEDIRTLAYKHLIKADDIIENQIIFPERKVFGLLYNIEGNTASSVNFFITDSIENFFSGALYFYVKPNKDSLDPVISFFKKDIEHLIETFKWN